MPVTFLCCLHPPHVYIELLEPTLIDRVLILDRPVQDKVYLAAVEKLSLKPSECAMVASHLSDLKAAKSNGPQAIYVERSPEEDWSDKLVENARTKG